MSITKDLLTELTQESVVTKKMLERIPADQYDWRPHPKSMSIHQLAGHIAELPGWVSLAFNTEELDFEQNTYTPLVWDSNATLLEHFEKALASGQQSLEQATDEDLSPRWVLRSGKDIFLDITKGGMVRQALSQVIHHRAQLGVYLRLLNIPIPGTYGPSADEQTF